MSRRRALRAALAGAALTAGAALAADRWVAATPLPPLAAPTSVLAADRHGVPLRVFLAADDRWRLPVALDTVDPAYLEMLIAYEDKRFYRHAGVDPLALARAARDSLLAGRIVSGGSTLTMQVARLLDDGTTGRWTGKLRQIRLALALERVLSKREILEIYLSRAPFGGNIEGVRAGAFSWFGKDARRLAPAEAALLVALPQAPEARRPDRAPGVARAARNAVLRRAAAAGALDPALLDRARAAPVPSRRRAFPDRAWHLADRARADAPAAPVHRLPVEAGAQGAIEDLLARAVEGLPPGVAAAATVYDHRAGQMLAQVGAARAGRAARGGYIDMTRAVRSPGSALKPFVYALAFADGLAHPETRLNDRPTDFGGYAPRNFDGGFRGPVSARQALQASLNVPAVALLDALGPRRLVAFLNRAGASPHTPDGAAPGLAAALGGLGLSLQDLVSLYAVLARGGQDAEGRRLLDPAAAWYVTDILRGAPPPEAGAGGDIAFKTGTSYGYRDAWAVGYDGAHVVGIWVGRPDGGSVPGLSGQGTAAPLLFQAFGRLGPRRAALPGPPPAALTGGLADLPAPLRVLGGGADEGLGVALAYPPAGATLQLAAPAGGDAAHLVAKLERGTPPFTWMIDQRVIAWDRQARSLVWPVADPGFVTVTVLDAAGTSARATVLVQRP
ncbi:penicillin-binding protein 1C [Rhodobacteraceae bacterium 2CG4]|uniref:peptidoglycan glycosyltransferase n=1 Tax=Halovulum marinum TaxID=2662447 RepID=A0A6L5YWL3_9RHOB|nr:penicillin-binding protein 1C [Halovulum marinum]MSU88329.1 penicillin-binding protein 1C [Halovulum marinum]